MKLILVCLFFGMSMTFAQQSAVDSLKKELERAKNDIDRARLLNQVADEYKTIDPKQLSAYARKALQLAVSIRYKAEEANAKVNLGIADIISGNYREALRLFAEAQFIFESELNAGNKKEEVRKGLARAYGSMGVVFSEQSSYAKALQFDLKAVSIYEQLNDIRRCARIYNNIGIIYQAQKQDFKALDYFIKSWKKQQQTKDPNQGITLTNIGNCYARQKDMAKAFQFYSKAKAFLEKHGDARGLGELYNNLGLYYKSQSDAANAIINWDLATAAFRNIDDRFGLADTQLYLGQFYFDQKQFPKAILYANQALGLAKETAVLEQVTASQKLLSDSYAALNDTKKALQHMRLFDAAKDSLNNHESIRKSVEAEMNFEFDKREALQKKEMEKKELLFAEASKRHTMQTFFVVLFVLLLGGIALLIYSRINLKKTLTLQKELAEYEQKALHLQMNPHFVFNCLGSISSFIVQNGTDSAIKYLAKFSKLMRLTLEYSKEPLIPIDKEIESLQNYLELEQLRFNQKFTFNIHKNPAIEDDMAIPPLLLQPFAENAIIHGLIPIKEKGHLAIAFVVEEKHLVCTIIDNGVGIYQSQRMKEGSVSVHKSMAIDITKKRLQMIEDSTSVKARLQIEELKDGNSIKGTKVTLRLPLQYLSK
ncbi:tetratricopeptide repeat-containing sensor histidine kinase [Flavobacterium pallidum]|nr:tetratricopeptide repeat protein [Flavobacterium pallidum]